ncbi:hypothetical protein [Flavobacterium hydatis]|uniref:Uncharacterized protein n=1 Tax=Flavobacterium hydatis TaxID=991 RepID=A0A086A3H5_FLAHY|nr:hypothetical protein [Flavobacterium hydatis]KFF11239.1 hypothetical protein IW20_20130 [Flavobacterium hydatis]OXA97908.1 hypothetical protein B0A62_03355 [Flavobacterium hydatis]
MKEITKKESSTDTYKINKPLKLNTINKGEPVDNVLVHDANNEIKSVPRSEFGGGSQSFQDVVTKSTVDMGGTAVASVEDPIDATKRGALIVGKTDGVNMGAVITSSTSTSVGSYITEMGKIKMIQSTPDGTIKTELKINEPKVASNIYVPAPDVAGDYILATTQDISLDKAAAIGSTITDKEVIFNTTATDIKTSITKEGVLILENGINDLGPTELKTLIGKNSITITEKGFREEGGGSEGGVTLARKNDANFSSNTVIKPTETETLIDKKSITITEKGFLRDDGETKVLINKNNVSLSRINPTESEINEIGLDADEWNLYTYQGDRGFNANPFRFAFSEGRHNVSFMLDGPINQTTQVRFNPLGGDVTYEDSFKTINGKSIVGSGDIVLSATGEFKTINGQSIIGTGNIAVSATGDFKTINGQSIVGTGNITVTGTPVASTFQDILNAGKVSTTSGQDHHFQLRSQFYDGGPYHDMTFKRNSIRLEFGGGGYVFDEEGIYPVRNLASSFGYGGFALTSGGISFKTNPIGGMATIKSDNLTSNYTFQLPGNIEVGGTQTLATTNDIAAYVASRTVINSTTTLLTSADLNTTYPTATAGFRVMALNIPSEKVIYEKIANGWIKTVVSVL